VPPPVSLVLIIFTLFFIGFGCVILKFISYFGWSKLAKRYSTFTRPEGASHHWQSMSLGRFLNYSRCITFRISENGPVCRSLPSSLAWTPPSLFPMVSYPVSQRGSRPLWKKLPLRSWNTTRGAVWQCKKKCTELFSVKSKVIEPFKNKPNGRKLLIY
jgi:hypothetical protein